MAAERTIAPDKRTVNWLNVSRVDENRFLTKNTMHPICDLCQITGHIGKWCPIKKMNQNPTSSRDRSPLREHDNNNSDYNAREEFRNDSRPASRWRTTSSEREPCHRYNSELYCYKPRCNNPHVCNVCGENHPGGRCNNTTSSRFRGGTRPLSRIPYQRLFLEL